MSCFCAPNRTNCTLLVCQAHCSMAAVGGMPRRSAVVIGGRNGRIRLDLVDGSLHAVDAQSKVMLPPPPTHTHIHRFVRRLLAGIACCRPEMQVVPLMHLLAITVTGSYLWSPNKGPNDLLCVATTSTLCIPAMWVDVGQVLRSTKGETAGTVFTNQGTLGLARALQRALGEQLC
jgi:hypothetical protein